MADPTSIINKTAPMYAEVMGEAWDELTEERKMLYRSLAFRVYEVHVKNRLDAMQNCIEVIEGVQTAQSTPKGWLRGVQESKNALVLYHLTATEELQTRPSIPEELPEDFNVEDPYATLRAGDTEPETTPEGLQCGAQHEFNWTCTRPAHPEHWMHWDADPGDNEDLEDLTGTILATWKDGETLESLHPVFGDPDD